MKQLLYLFLSFIVSSCKIQHDVFFDPISVDDVGKIDTDTIDYLSESMDCAFPEIGVLSLPKFNSVIKYDTLSQYRVRFVGGVVFRTDSVEVGPKEIDSVYISAIHIHSRGDNYICYTKQNYNNWKTCPIPVSIMGKLRDDFFLRMKYQKYELKFPISHKTTGTFLYNLY